MSCFYSSIVLFDFHVSVFVCVFVFVLLCVFVLLLPHGEIKYTVNHKKWQNICDHNS